VLFQPTQNAQPQNILAGGTICAGCFGAKIEAAGRWRMRNVIVLSAR